MGDSSREGLRRDVARLFCIGFDGLSLPDDARDLLARGVGGVILFRRNVPSDPRDIDELTRQVKSIAARPVLVSVDQEGGRVARLREPFTPLPTMRQLGQTCSVELARQVGAVIARELRAVNIDLNFAPVVDVDTNPANPVIGDRSPGDSPQLVADMGVGLIQGMQSVGVGACAKHFPGHGDTDTDSHLDLPRLPHDLPRLDAVELPPFQAAIAAGVASIMSAHVVFEALDRTRPATLSRAALDGILRDRMGFNDGVVISDDLEMNAIAKHFGLEQAVIDAVLAGVDLLLVCHHASVQNQAIDLLLSAVERGVVPRQRIAQANARLDRLFERFVRDPVDRSARRVIGSDAHRAIVQRVGGAVDARPDPTEAHAPS